MNGTVIKIKEEEYIEAKNLAENRNLPFVDCLIAIEARNHNAIIISQDKHFERLTDIAKTIKPQYIND
jgi:predicted nucleic acid-binding protein